MTSSYEGYGIANGDDCSSDYCTNFELQYRERFVEYVEAIQNDPTKLEDLDTLLEEYLKDRIVIDAREVLLYDAAFHCIDQDNGALLRKLIHLTSNNVFAEVPNFNFNYYRYNHRHTNVTTLYRAMSDYGKPDYSQSLLVYASKHRKFNCVKVLLDSHNYFSRDELSQDLVIFSFLECLKNGHDALIKYFVESILRRKAGHEMSYVYSGGNILECAYSSRHWQSEADSAIKNIDWTHKCTKDLWYRQHIKYLVPYRCYNIIIEQFEETEKGYVVLLLKEYLPLPVDIVKYVIRAYL